MNFNNTYFMLVGGYSDSYTQAHVCGLYSFRKDDFICPACGSYVVGPRYTTNDFKKLYMQIIRPIKDWPDAICVNASPYELVNDRIIHDLREAGIKNFRVHPVPIQDVPTKKMPPWKYWFIEPIHGTVQYRPVVNNEYRENINQCICLKCKLLLSEKFGHGVDRLPYPYYQLDEKFCTGNDIVWVIRNGEYFVGYSERIVDLAYDKKWTNACFGNFENRVFVNFESPNWRENLVLKNQEINETRSKEIQEYYNRLEMEKGRGVSLDNIPITETPKPVERPEYYPFKEYDNAFGEYLRIYLSSPLLFGEGWFDIDFDGKYNEGKAFCYYILTPEQCAFYKYFIDRTNRLIPEIKRVLLDQLRVIQKDHPEITPPVDVPDFCTLAEWMTNPEISMFEPPTETGGEISLTYEVMSTDLIVLVTCHFIFVADSVEVTGKIVEKE